MIFAAGDSRKYQCPVKMGIRGFGNCVSTECAAWRWVTTAELERKFIQSVPPNLTIEPTRPPKVPASWTWRPYGDDYSGWLETVNDAKQRSHGYCGMAGKP